MMYSEFVEGTGCKDNEYNYKVFQDLEIMYMNSDLTKEQIYEYGKKLVDNSKSESEIEFENKINLEISILKEELKNLQHSYDFYSDFIGYKDTKKYFADEIKRVKRSIKNLKWCLN